MTNSSKDTVAFANTELAADSAAYVEALYEQYMADSQSVSKEWQDYFATYRQEMMHHTMQSKSSFYCWHATNQD